MRLKKRFAAMLLFQFRVVIKDGSGKRRLCEKRIINFLARNSVEALKVAELRGHASQYSYKNSEGNPVFFEFVGVLDLQCLTPACESDEVWFDIVQMLMPMERKKSLISPVGELNAIRNNE